MNKACGRENDANRVKSFKEVYSNKDSLILGFITHMRSELRKIKI